MNESSKQTDEVNKFKLKQYLSNFSLLSVLIQAWKYLGHLHFPVPGRVSLHLYRLPPIEEIIIEYKA